MNRNIERPEAATNKEDGKMKKFWIVYGVKNDGRFERFDTYDEAEADARRKVNGVPGCDYFISESIAVVKQPIPAVEVVKLT